MELIRKEQNSFQYFDKVTSLDRGHSFLFIYLLLIYIYIHIFKHYILNPCNEF